MNVSVVIPAKNEAETIGQVLEELIIVTNKLRNYKFEIIVVDDGSKDSTSEIAKKYNTTVIKNPGSSGKGHALKAGFRKCNQSDIVVMMDADYSHCPEELPLFLKEIENGAGLVVGSRILGGSDEYGFIRALGNILLTATFRLMFNYKATDVLNGYKVFKKDLIQDFEYSSKGFEIEVELVGNALRTGYKVVEVRSHERSRAGGKLKSRVFVEGPKFLFKIIIEGIKFQISRRD